MGSVHSNKIEDKCFNALRLMDSLSTFCNSLFEKRNQVIIMCTGYFLVRGMNYNNDKVTQKMKMISWWDFRGSI